MRHLKHIALSHSRIQVNQDVLNGNIGFPMYFLSTQSNCKHPTTNA